jgi:hypothetical protein
LWIIDDVSRQERSSERCKLGRTAGRSLIEAQDHAEIWLDTGGHVDDTGKLDGVDAVLHKFALRTSHKQIVCYF